MGRTQFSREEREFAEAIDELCYVNPFSPARQALERRALGSHYRETEDAWALGPGHRNANLLPLKQKAREWLERALPRYTTANADELRLYSSVLRFFSYYEFLPAFELLTEQSEQTRFSQRKIGAFGKFQKLVYSLLPNPALATEWFGSLEHLFACQFQLFRAFRHIFGTIVGASHPAQRLRAAVWESVFTSDMRRYERGLYRTMHRINTLILGPSGTGKELVARAIGMSRYLPFDDGAARFEEEVTDGFFAVNISALSTSLVESELFGHKRGSFTGAINDRVGLFEACPEHGTLFLDEVGELDQTLQVKLLRTLQAREFQRVGDLQARAFRGKLVSATNRNLEGAVAAGTMREDFFYRLCSDVVETPSLRAQLQDKPSDLKLLVAHAARRHFDDADAVEIAAAACKFIEKELGSDYPWLGNVRELEQCVLSVAVRGSYRGLGRSASPSERAANGVGDLATAFLEANMDVERLLDVYCTLAYDKTGSLSEAGRRLGLDRRTVKARLDRALLARLKQK